MASVLSLHADTHSHKCMNVCARCEYGVSVMSYDLFWPEAGLKLHGLEKLKSTVNFCRQFFFPFSAWLTHMARSNEEASASATRTPLVRS